MESTNYFDDTEIIRWEFAFSTLFYDKGLADRMSDFRKKHKLRGNQTWGELRLLDKDFADEYEKYLYENKPEIKRRYTEAYTNIMHNEIKNELKKEMKAKDPNKKRGKAKSEIKSEKQKKESPPDPTIDELINLDVNKLKIRQLIEIIGSRNLNIDITPYIQRLQELKSGGKSINYNKIPDIKTAKALITKVFSGRAKPSMWINYPEIINAKLYSVKMGIQYLERERPEALQEVLNDFQPKIDALLKDMGINDINDIKF